jgi:hypothetical protein
MVRWLWLLVVLVGCAPVQRAEAPYAETTARHQSLLDDHFGLPAPGGPYFPPASAQPATVCEYGDRRLQVPAVGEFEDRWFSRHLAAAREPSLYRLSQAARASGRVTLRFTWLRSFHAPVIVRVESDGDSHRLIAKVLSGAGGYNPGEIERQTARPLSADEARRLRMLLSRNHFFDLPGSSCEFGCDGAQWIFERVDESGYRVLNRWTPRHGPSAEVGAYLLDLTGWRFEDMY